MRKFSLIFVVTFILLLTSNSKSAIANDYPYDSLMNALHFSTGKIPVMEGAFSIDVPEGFRFLNKQQSQEVLEHLWGNPRNNSVLGMLFPKDRGPVDSSAWAFIVSYKDIGYVSDKDANEIDYTDLLKQIQKDIEAVNPEREKEGYQPIHLLGWASTPYYDGIKKTLHWAKKVQFGQEPPILNYEIRVLGRKGVISLNAVGDLNNLGEIKEHINPIIASLNFESGSKYSDFDPSIDQVAAYTVGGLVAGKVLLSKGFWVVLLKFWKFIAIALVGVGSFFAKFFKRNREKQNFYGRQ